MSLKLGYIPYGTVYLVDRDLTLAEKKTDLQNIKKMRFNTVVLWPAVSRWDANPPGGTAFKSVDQVMDLCARIGLKVILELQGQNTSNAEAPECFRVTENKLDLNNPEYQALTRNYLREVAEHYKGHPALVAYDIYNEIGFHAKDIWTVREFIRYLKVKYQDIQKLNYSWGTYFACFDDIQQMTPNYGLQYDIWYSAVPQRDWLTFRYHNWTVRLDEWSAVIRSVDPHVVLLADVLGNDTIHSRSMEYFGATDWSVAEHVEVLGLSCWANMLGPKWTTQDSFRWAQFWRASLAAARGKQVMISELMTPNRTMFPREGSSMTDQIRLWSYHVMFNGIQGLIYWKWRAFRKGVQVAGRGLCDLAAQPNEHAYQAAEVATFVEKNRELLAQATPDSAGCAILHDHNAQDIYAAIHTPEFYTDAHCGMFRGFWTKGTSPAYIIPDDLKTNVPAWVKVLAVPVNASVSQKTASSLVRFMQKGGVLFTESRFGLLNEDATLWPHVPGGNMYKTVGWEEKSFTCLFNDTLAAGKETLEFKNDYFQYLTLGKNVQVKARTAGNQPVLLVCKVGKGLMVHVPYIISQKINSEAPAAQAAFNTIYEILKAHLCPAVAVNKKDALVDVSVLLDAKKKPLLVGITNFEHKETMVRLAWDKMPAKLEGDKAARVELKGKELLVTVPARRAAAVFI
jgi:beta-galactosidase GanA